MLPTPTPIPAPIHTRRRPGVAPSVLAVLAALGLALPAMAQEPLVVGPHTFHRKTLPNGLVAIAVREQDARASVFMVIGAGKRHETPDTTGLAHLTEHAMYAGTAKTGLGQHDRRIRAMGGESNAFTREDYTLFYDHQIPAEQLPTVLAMEADRLRGLTFDVKAVRFERGRLEREETQTYEPTDGRRELLESKVFTTHNYRAGLLDDKGHTKAPGLEVPAVREFYNRYYQPEHTAVVVVGDFEPAVAFAMVERAFGHLPRGPKRPPLAAEPAIEQVREVLIPSPLSRQRSTLAWVVPELGHPDRPALDALARLLSRRTAAGGTPIEAEMGGRVDRELFLLSATGDKAAAALQEVLADVHAETCAADEVEAVKRLLAETYSTLPLRARPYFSLAGTMGVYAVLGHPDHPADYAARIEELTPARLREVARRQLPAERYVAVTFGRSVEAAVALPHDPHALQKAAAAAVEAGELDRAILAYTRLLAMGPNKMFKVIYLSSRGQVKVKQKDYDGAIADYVAALSVVDYPAVRTLLKEARELKAGAGNAGEGNAGAGKTAKPASRPTPGDKR